MIADPRLREDDEKRRGDDKRNGVLGAEPLGEGVVKYTARWRLKAAMTTGM